MAALSRNRTKLGTSRRPLRSAACSASATATIKTMTTASTDDHDETFAKTACTSSLPRRQLYGIEKTTMHTKNSAGDFFIGSFSFAPHPLGESASSLRDRTRQASDPKGSAANTTMASASGRWISTKYITTEHTTATNVTSSCSPFGFRYVYISPQATMSGVVPKAMNTLPAYSSGLDPARIPPSTKHAAPAAKHTATNGSTRRSSSSEGTRRETANNTRNTANVHTELTIQAMSDPAVPPAPATTPKNVMECSDAHCSAIPASASRIPAARRVL